MSEKNDKCKWQLEDDTGIYYSQCGDAFIFEHGDMEDNKFKYCPYCGGRIE